MRPARVDALIDLGYGALILVSIALIATVELRVGLTFGLGVFAAYLLHVVWKMARFDPDWMTRAVEESVEKQVEDTVERTVGETMEKQAEDIQSTVERTVGETVEKRVEEVQTRVEAVDERVDRRPREDEVEEIVEESVEDESRP